jgi:hypothetical protein
MKKQNELRSTALKIQHNNSKSLQQQHERKNAFEFELY